jgi:hypothetical protein
MDEDELEGLDEIGRLKYRLREVQAYLDFANLACKHLARN